MPVRLLAGVGPPLAVGVAWWVGYGIVDAWPESPYGDTDFAWLPLFDMELTPVLTLLGLVVLAVREAWGVLIASAALWLLAVVLLFVAIPGYGQPYMFPDTGRTLLLMATCAAASIIPTLLVALWAAVGKVAPQGEEATDSSTAGESGDLGAAPAQLPVGAPDQVGTEARSEEEARPATGSFGVSRALWKGPLPAGPPPGWYAVPGGHPGQLRWWDGTAWTGYVWPPG